MGGWWVAVGGRGLSGLGRSVGETAWGLPGRGTSPAPAAVCLLQVLVPGEDGGLCALHHRPRVLPCHLPLQCRGPGPGGLEDLHSAESHNRQGAGTELEGVPHSAGPLEPGGCDLVAGHPHAPGPVHHLCLLTVQLPAR